MIRASRWLVCLLLLAPAFEAQALYDIAISAQKSKEDGHQTVRAEANYPHSPKSVWRVLENFNEYRRIFPFMKISRILKKEESQRNIRFVLKPEFPYPDIDNTVAMVEHREGDQKHYRWDLLSGNVRKNQGSIRVTPRDEKNLTSHVTIEFHLDPGLLCPQWLVLRGAKRYMPVVMRRLGYRIAKLRRQEARARKEARKKENKLPQPPSNGN